MKIDKDFIIRRYKNKIRLKSYASRAGKGLFPEEELLIKKYIKYKSKILVVGCGTGREIIGLKKIGFKNIVGLDVSPDMIREAKKLVQHVKFIVSDINDFHSNDKFDVVLYLNNIIEQIPSFLDRKKAILKSKELLRGNGIIILTTHSSFYPGSFGSVLIKNFILYLLYKLGLRKDSPFDYVNERDKIYAHFSNPFEIKKILHENQFIIKEINSKKFILNNKKSSFLYLFDEPIYYIAELNLIKNKSKYGY